MQYDLNWRMGCTLRADFYATYKHKISPKNDYCSSRAGRSKAVTSSGGTTAS